MTDTTGVTVLTNAAAPAGLQVSGQFRIVIDSEIMLVTAGASGTSWTVTRGGSLSAPDTCTPSTHPIGATIYHYLTAGALSAAGLGGLLPWGHTNIATSEARTNAGYGTLTTPDQVVGVVLPTDGLVLVGYQAQWAESVAGAASANIFLGANGLKAATGNGGGSAPIDDAIGTAATSTASVFAPLTTGVLGLYSGVTQGGTTAAADVSTGQVVGYFGGPAGSGGPLWIFAAAGTYTVSVQYKATSGSVTAKNRHLWVATLAFP
jgi:hypothetical protein